MQCNFGLTFSGLLAQFQMFSKLSSGRLTQKPFVRLLLGLYEPNKPSKLNLRDRHSVEKQLRSSRPRSHSELDIQPVERLTTLSFAVICYLFRPIS